MPRVPSYESSGRSVRGVNGMQQISVDADAFGASVGRAMSGFGDTITQASGKAMDILQMEKDRADEAAVRDLDVQFSQWTDTFLNDAENGYLTQKGKNASTARDIYIKKLEEQADALSKGLNPAQSRMWEKLKQSRVTSTLGTINNHARQQFDVYEAEGIEARIESQKNQALSHVEPEKRKLAIEVGIAEIKNKAKRNGWSEEQLTNEVNKYRSGIHYDILKSMIANERYDAAQQYFTGTPDGKGGVIGQMVQAERDEILKLLRSETMSTKTQGVVDDLMANPDMTLEAGLKQIRADLSGEQEKQAIAELKLRFAERETTQDLALHNDTQTYVDALLAPGHEMDLEQALAQAREDLDGKLENNVVAAIKTRFAEQKAIEDEQRKVQTQQYVDKLLLNNDNMTREVALQVARNTLDGDDETAAVQEINQRFNERDAAETQAKTDMYLEYAAQAAQGTKFTPSQEQNFYAQGGTPSQWDAIEKISLDARGALPIVHDGEAWSEFMAMSAQEMVELGVAGFNEKYGSRVDAAHRERAESLIHEYSNQTPKAAAAQKFTSLGTVKQQVDNVFARLGKKTGNKVYAQFVDQVNQEILTLEQQLGGSRKATPKEINDIVERNAIQVDVFRDWWPDTTDQFPFQIDPDDYDRTFVPFEEIPDNEVVEIKQTLTDNGIINPQNKLIEDLYAAYALRDKKRMKKLIEGAK